jgi:hypothetical protein
MASTRFVYALQPLLNALAAREKAARLGHARAVSVLDRGVRELVAVERGAGRLARAFARVAPAWQHGEIDLRLARLEAACLVRLGEIAAARGQIKVARDELEAIARRREAVERHRARCFERHRRELDALDEAELEEAELLRRGSPLAGCEHVSA